MIEEEITIDDSVTVQDTADALLPIVISPEANFLRLPFFAVSWRGLKTKTTTEYRYLEERDGKKVELLWQVSANALFGYPNPFDRKVARAVDALIDETYVRNGYLLEDEPIPFSIYRVARLMGISRDSAAVYKRIRESIERIKATTVVSQGSFWLKDKKMWVRDAFNLYTRVRFKGMEMPTKSGSGIAETNYLWLDEYYRRNINARCTRLLDYHYLRSLQSDLASRLYELLSGKFYGLPKDLEHFRIGYSTLCELLPITPQKYYSKAKEKLDRAHEELISTGYLAKVVYQRQKGKKNDFNILYYLGTRAKAEKRGELLARAQASLIEEQMKLPLSKSEEKRDNQLIGLALELHERGVSRGEARRFVKDYSETYIREKIEILDVRKAAGDPPDKAGAFLSEAIRKDYTYSDEQYEAWNAKVQERKDAEADADRRERWKIEREKRIQVELDEWDKTPAEERIEQRFNMHVTVNFGGDRDSEGAQAKKQELIDALPKTEAARRHWIERNIPADPPEDFE